MNQTLKNIIAFSILAGVAVIGYFLFIQRDATTLLSNQDEIMADLLLVQARSFIEKRRALEALAIDTSVLLDPKFTSLDTFTVPVVTQPVGKTSLFEPAQTVSGSQ